MKPIPTPVFILVLVLFSMRAVAQLAVEEDSLISDAPDFQELRIDPDFASTASEKDLFDSVSYVFLETTRASEVSTVSQLEVSDKHYIIFDKRLQAIYFFYKDGRFDKKLSAPKDFERIGGFIIHPSAQRLIVNDFSSFNYIFDLEGNPIEKVEKVVYLADFAYLDDFKLQYNGFNISEDVGGARITNYPNFLIINKKDSTQKNFLWFNPQDSLSYDIYSERCFYRSEKNRVLFARELDNIIYSFDGAGHMQRQFKVILPLQNSLPLDFLTNSDYKGKRIEFLSSNQHVSHKISDVYQIGDWLTFRAFFYKPIFFHLPTGEYFDFMEMESNNMGFKTTGISNEIVGVDDKAFIAPIPHIALKYLYNKLSAEDRKMVPEDFRDAAKKSYHNPILKLLYIKEK